MKNKTAFFCSECGYESAKWLGKCPGCGAWNTMVEQPTSIQSTSARNKNQGNFGGGRPERLNEICITEESRIPTGIHELDRVLGGGIVRGSLVLVGGEPGIGKSTLLLQICQSLCQNMTVLYASGEESQTQLKLRANRLKIETENLLVLAETDLDHVLNIVREEQPQILIVDSIQTVYSHTLDATPGNIAQVRECTMALMNLAKGVGTTVFVIGHVNKEGAIAGPKVLEHMVDCVLYFEGERHMSYRILRAVKNRFGSTNELGVFDMGERGLVEVENPSSIFLSGRPEKTSGTCVACILEGTRPMLAEIQALVTPTSFGTPRRMSAGIDYNRAMLLLAVLEKRAGIYLGSSDAYLNVVGGFHLDEPAADLPTLLSVASSVKDCPIIEGTASFGEIGLTGELRNVSGAQQRLQEIHRMGFRRCILPQHGATKLSAPEGLELYPVRTLREAISIAFE